ncbi:hypothetical protein BJF89_00940 [Corynebacterium sp. CNJ-954]|uniref:hypothetical protein n=1 Tax=Corynebacterium sp. CNJ-954 TaxID=1904962 RepID=UPI000965ADDE|nr:hypothetical protein [Corynebacterium sp. CNJ-954]OLT54830.1 hypothetical protein BJF89_00940 [Corynebacterium sp. CNJ-954]
MTNRQLDFMFENEPPVDVHPMAQLFLHPLGMKFTPEMMNELATFIFDMCGAKLHDVAPSTVEYFRDWKDDREVDEYVPGAEYTAAWSENLPTGISVCPRTGHMAGTLPAGQYRWTVRLGPQVRYDSLGGSGSPHEDGLWIGALEERQGPASPQVDVSSMTPEQKAALRAALDQED